MSTTSSNLTGTVTGRRLTAAHLKGLARANGAGWATAHPVAIPLLIALGQVFRASVLARRRAPEAFAEIDAFNAVGIALVTLGGLFLVSPRGVRLIRQVLDTPLRYVFMYFACCGFSALLSDDPVYGLYRAVELCITLLLLCYVFAAAQTLRQRLILLLGFLCGSTILGIIGRGRLAGTTLEALHTNDVTCCAAMGFVACLSLMWGHVVSLRGLGLLTVFFAALLYIGSSAGSMVAAACGLMILFLVSGRFSEITVRAVLMGAVCTLAVAFAREPLQELLFPNKTLVQIQTAHGRTGMWELYFQGFLERPLLGYGFPSGEKFGDRFGWVVTSSSHNAIVSIAINTGLVGLALFAGASIAIMSATWRAYLRGNRCAPLVLSVSATTLANSMTYPVLGSHWFWPCSSFFAVLAFACCSVWPVRTALKGRQPR